MDTSFFDEYGSDVSDDYDSDSDDDFVPNDNEPYSYKDAQRGLRGRRRGWGNSPSPSFSPLSPMPLTVEKNYPPYDSGRLFTGIQWYSQWGWVFSVPVSHWRGVFNRSTSVGVPRPSKFISQVKKLYFKYVYDKTRYKQN